MIAYDAGDWIKKRLIKQNRIMPIWKKNTLLCPFCGTTLNYSVADPMSLTVMKGEECECKKCGAKGDQIYGMKEEI